MSAKNLFHTSLLWDTPDMFFPRLASTALLACVVWRASASCKMCRFSNFNAVEISNTENLHYRVQLTLAGLRLLSRAPSTLRCRENSFRTRLRRFPVIQAHSRTQQLVLLLMLNGPMQHSSQTVVLASAVSFAQKHHNRPVIKDTGHNIIGR